MDGFGIKAKIPTNEKSASPSANPIGSHIDREAADMAPVSLEFGKLVTVNLPFSFRVV